MLSGMTPFPAPAPTRRTPAWLLVIAIVLFIPSVALLLGSVAMPAIGGGIATGILSGSLGALLFAVSVAFIVLAIQRQNSR
jgi:hypothetical protein